MLLLDLRIRPGDNIQPEDVSWEQDFEKLENEAEELLKKYTDSSSVISAADQPPADSSSRVNADPSKVSTKASSKVSTKASSKYVVGPVQSRIAQAQFMAMERERASKASLRG